MRTYDSYYFETWTQASAVSFRRGPRTENAVDRWNQMEEVHLGAGLWNRGNVVLGIYGMWHGHATGDREYITMDLGFVVSNDALHFREPIPDFRLVASWEEAETPLGLGPALMQGQGMPDLQDKTLLWYESWRAGGVRLVKLDRDRLGYFSTFGKPDDPHLITCPLEFSKPGGIFINADRLGEHTSLRVELLHRQFRQLPGYSGESAALLQRFGLRQTGAVAGPRSPERLERAGSGESEL